MMSYPYSRYRDDADVEAHIRDFLTTWEINHAAQRVSAAAEDKSKIDEFVLSLDGADVEAHIRDFLTTWEINHATQRLSAVPEDKSKIDEFVLSLDGADVEAHIRDFLTTWKINHAAQRLSAATEGKSKIDEFVQSLDGPLANWFAQNGIRAFESFEQLTTKFTQLFHRQIPQKDLIGQFYAVYQEPNETVSQFVIRFQSLQLQIAEKIPDAELKDIFLEAIHEPLRSLTRLLLWITHTRVRQP